MRISSLLTGAAVAVTLLVAAPGVVHAISCDTLPEPRVIDFDSMAVFQFQANGASCWGWQAPDGRHYAIMGGGRSIGFVDVQTMTIVDTVPTQACQWRELKTYRNYCYAVSECFGDKQGMMIIDMKYLPDSVHYVGSYVSGGNTKSHCISIDTARGFCYLVRQNYSGFRIVSLANPEAPVDVGGVNTGDLHDMTAFNDTVYAAEGDNSSYSIWNCTNKAAPAFITRVTIPGDGYVHNVWPTNDRRFLASTEEIPQGRTLKVWDIQNFQNISKVSDYIGPGQIPHNAHVEGNYLFVAHYSSGVSILDFNYPECPITLREFDTYTQNNNPDYLGCWGVYPHTNGSGWVYASNIDGRLFIFKFTVQPYAASADFAGTPTIGNVPFNANFTSQGLDLNSWSWDFGDGGQSTSQNPIHTYTTSGIYDVSLAVAGSGVDTLAKPNYVVALAETLLVSDTGFDRGTQVSWNVNLSNSVPVTEIKLPISLSGIPAYASFDSLSFVGCRTSYFELKQIIFNAPSLGQIVVQLRANLGGNSPDLAPGSGPVARVHMTIHNSAPPGNTIALGTPTVGGHSLTAITAGLSYQPASEGATATITGPPCDCSCHADPTCDGSANIQDVVGTIAVAFRDNAPTVDPACFHSGRSDVNCSGSTDILDVVLMIGVTFRNDDPDAIFCDPCE